MKNHNYNINFKKNGTQTLKDKRKNKKNTTVLKARVKHYSDKKCRKILSIDRQGNWQKVGKCGKQSPGVYAKYLQISKNKTSHKQYYDSLCTKPKSKLKTVKTNTCQPSTVIGDVTYSIQTKYF